MEGSKSEISRTYSRFPNTRSSKITRVGIAVAAVLFIVNAWLVRHVVSSNSHLPRLTLGFIDTATLLVDRPNDLSAITWDSTFSILILGRSGGNHIAPDLTDTIMLLHVDSAASPPSVRIVSIPRDLLVRVEDPHTRELYFRANALWLYAQKNEDPAAFTKNIFEQIVGTPIDRLVLFDLATIKKIVEKTDGVTVYVPEDIYDPRFPTDRGGYETFSLPRGWRYLSAADAMRFARTRASVQGDFDRMRHQQELIRAVKGKISGLNPLWNFPTLWSIFSLVKEELVTDITPRDIRNLWTVSEHIAFDDIDFMSIDVSSGAVEPRNITIQGSPASVLVASGEDSFNYAAIKDAVNRFLIK